MSINNETLKRLRQETQDALRLGRNDYDRYVAVEPEVMLELLNEYAIRMGEFQEE